MKKGILFLLLAGTFTANAQSLKDLLYSGKLKKDSNTVIRKTDDLSTKIDTGQKKGPEPKITTVSGDSLVKKLNPVTGDSSFVKKVNPQADSLAIVVEAADSLTSAGADIKDNIAPVKSNNKIWKEYTDSLVSSLKTEVLSSKKIKKETYYLMIEYEIGTDGKVNITNVISTPENAFLQGQVTERMHTPPQLTPALDSANQPRKVKRKYSFNITKE